ncbi:glycosyltransferase family 2 protein [Methylopila henanensis]|uniref:Glycosyltransferase family 2 protein n=1 Tax=Methylopila henanensis TaxID=873516 RepID=A0ABW4K4I0_9HYPH
MPSISVVMPVYNRERVVRRAVDSVLAQTFVDFELLVVDDGSSDGTAAAVEAFADPRVRLLRQPENRGGNAARNRGVREAQAPLIAFIDSDDRFLPGKLAYVADYFARRPDVDVLIDSFELVYPPETGKPKALRTNPVLDDSAAVETAIFARRMFKATPSISLRKEAIVRAGLFDEALKRRQDFDLMLRLVKTARCASTDAVLWTKEWSTDAISAKADTFMAATIDLCRRHPDYLGAPAHRVGLARDLARHFLRLAGKGRIGAAVADARRFSSEFGAGRLAGLVAEGVGEIVRRKRERSRKG